MFTNKIDLKQGTDYSTTTTTTTNSVHCFKCARERAQTGHPRHRRCRHPRAPEEAKPAPAVANSPGSEPPSGRTASVPSLRSVAAFDPLFSYIVG